MLGENVFSLTHGCLEKFRKECSLPPKVAPLCYVYSPVCLSLHCQCPSHATSKSEDSRMLKQIEREEKKKPIRWEQLEIFQVLSTSMCDWTHTVFFHAYYMFKTEINTNEKKQNEMAERHAMYHCLWGAIFKLSLFSDPCPPL